MTCDGAQVVFIKKGKYGKVRWMAWRSGTIVQSPEHKSMFESFATGTSDYVYFDEKANEGTARGAEELAMHFLSDGGQKREYRLSLSTERSKGTKYHDGRKSGVYLGTFDRR